MGGKSSCLEHAWSMSSCPEVACRACKVTGSRFLKIAPPAHSGHVSTCPEVLPVCISIAVCSASSLEGAKGVGYVRNATGSRFLKITPPVRSERVSTCSGLLTSCLLIAVGSISSLEGMDAVRHVRNEAHQENRNFLLPAFKYLFQLFHLKCLCSFGFP